MRLLFDDVSVTAILTSLHDHWPSVGILSDEAGKLFNSKTFENIGLLNKLWEGADVSIDRHRTAGSYAVTGARLTISLMSQQKTLIDFLKKQGHLAREIGFLGRFLTCKPISTQGSRFILQDQSLSAPNSDLALSDFHNVLERLLRFAWQRHQDGGARIVVPMTAEAEWAWSAYYNTIEQQNFAHGYWYDVKDGASRAADNIARLACLFAAFESAEAPEKTTIQLAHVNAAEVICRWYMMQFKTLFGDESGLSSGAQNAEKLFSWLTGYWSFYQATHIEKRDLIRKGPSCVRDAKHLDEALLILERQNLVRMHTPRSLTGRRLPQQVWNPMFAPPQHLQVAPQHPLLAP